MGLLGMQTTTSSSPGEKQNDTMAYTTRKTLNRLTHKQLHLNHVVPERTIGINLDIELKIQTARSN